jgi:glycosyltransferase involved in cell wall biosynthesis
MRIAVVANTAWYLLNFRGSLMRRLIAAGHTVVAVAPPDENAEAIRQQGIVFEGVPISGGGTKPWVELGSVLALHAAFRRHDIELVLSYTPKGNLYSALACIARGITFVPNVSGLGRSFIRKSFVTRVVSALYRLTFGRARHVFFQNNEDRQIFIDAGFVSPQQSERLPGSGVDLGKFAASPASAPSSDQFDTAEPFSTSFLMVARMMWDKGVGEYVEAARQVRARHPQARFILLGFLDVDNPSAVSRAQMDEWVQEGVVEYQPPVKDVRPAMSAADCVVLPSYREGVPRTLLEAAALGRPVIATDVPGCRDTVVDGETGLLCRVMDASDLADKLERFVGMPRAERAELGAAGRRFVEANFDERIVLNRYADLVATIARERERPSQ